MLPACERAMRNDFHFSPKLERSWMIIRHPKYSHGRIISTLSQDDGIFSARPVQIPALHSASSEIFSPNVWQRLSRIRLLRKGPTQRGNGGASGCLF